MPLSSTIDKTVIILSGLTQKIVNIKSKADQCLTNENYIELNSKIDILSAMFNSNSNESDIVSLLNLPRAISEYTDDHIGEIIYIPYTDESGEILLNNGCIEFEVVGVNHHKDINDESKPTITLMTKNIIKTAAFDAKEPTNNVSSRASSGNNRWSVSNIRQWLNSEGVANEWFTPQHEYDAEPNADAFSYEFQSYADNPGFLAGFSDEIKQHFVTVKNKTILCNVDKSAFSKDYEETEDKVFLPSYTEMGFGNLDSNNPEGSHLAQKFINDESRIKNSANYYYWMRSPFPDTSCFVNLVTEDGYDEYTLACGTGRGVTPLLVLC